MLASQSGLSSSRSNAGEKFRDAGGSNTFCTAVLLLKMRLFLDDRTAMPSPPRLLVPSS
jgi:hypothetical protein